MPQYKYKAQAPDGKKRSGVLAAADEADLQQRLHEENLFLLSFKQLKKEHAARQMKAKVLSDFSRQLSTLTASGVTLIRALGIIATGEAVKPKEKLIYDDMIRLIRQGVALSDAMEAQNGSFPPLMIYMYRSAESSGNLDQVAMQMAILYEKDHRMNSKVSSALTYPKILCVMLVAVMLILMKFVMPQFEEMFSQMETLPLPTAILMAIGNVVARYWYLVILGIVLIWLGISAALRLSSVRYQWDKIKIHAPLFGKLLKTIYTARFARTLSSLYAAGIPIVTALQISKKTVGNAYIESQFDEAASFVRAGNNLSDGLEHIDGFTKKLIDAIRVGEETGSLDSMLLATSESMEYDSDMAIGRMVSYVEPGMMIVMGIIVGFVLVAVFSAMYGSYDAIAAVG